MTLEVCDSCLNIAWDNGFDTYEDQTFAVMELGGEVEDHNCDAAMEPELFPDGCGCGCRGTADD